MWWAGLGSAFRIGHLGWECVMVGVVVKADMYVRLQAMMSGVAAAHAREVDGLQGQAVAYVWGREDGEGRSSADDSWLFGNAYGLLAAEFACEWLPIRPNIRAAYERWLESGDVLSPAERGAYHPQDRCAKCGKCERNACERHLLCRC